MSHSWGRPFRAAGQKPGGRPAKLSCRAPLTTESCYVRASKKSNGGYRRPLAEQDAAYLRRRSIRIKPPSELASSPKEPGSGVAMPVFTEQFWHPGSAGGGGGKTNDT